jgi:hypothetical protein
MKKSHKKCIASGCSNVGCKLNLDKIASNHVIISGSKYQQHFHYSKKLCDFILFDYLIGVEYRLAVIEMKGGNLGKDDIKTFHSQLQNGADVACVLSRSFKIKTFIPVTVKKKSLNPMASKTLLSQKKYMIRFQYYYERIKILKHNTSLTFD